MRKRLKNHFVPHPGNNYKPHFVREKSVATLALIAIAIFGLAYSLKTFVTRNPGVLSAVITGVLVDLTNSNRQAANIQPLTFSPVLERAAQMKADDMASKGYFAHTSPDGKSPWYWFKESGYNFVYAGENLAVNFVDSGDVVQAWMDSEGHRANIMNSKFTEIGIAIAHGKFNGEDSIYVVQLFGKPAPRVQPIIAQVAQASTEEVLDVAASQTSATNSQTLAAPDSSSGESNSTVAGAEVSNTVEKAVASPKMVLKVLYSAILVIVLIALAIFVKYKPKNLHNKHVVYVVLLVALIAVLLYLSAYKLFPQIIIQ